MISVKDLRKIAQARLKDAKALLAAKRFDGAVYLCGYVIEIALKSRICRVLRWPGYPETRSEFEGLQSFKTHDLDLLLRLTGRDRFIKNRFLTEWSTVINWNPESRYNLIGTATPAEAKRMIEYAEVLLHAI